MCFFLTSPTMAWARCSLSPPFPPSSPNNSAIITTPKTPLSYLLSPSKPTKRKNYLRPKLLKTLTKPPHDTQSLPQTPLQNPIQIHETSQHEDLNVSNDPIFVQVSREGEENDTHVSEIATDRVIESPGVFSTRLVLELVLYVMGIFVVRSVYSVWSFGSVDFDKKRLESVRSSMSSNESNGKTKDDVLMSGNGVYRDDDSQLEEKVKEIREMAREVRESEAKKASVNGLVSVTSTNDIVGKDVVSRDKTNTIQKEVNGRLSKLEKRLLSGREGNSNSYMVNGEEGVEQSDSKVKYEKHMFKRQAKLKSSLDRLGSKTKGFQSVLPDDASEESVLKVMDKEEVTKDSTDDEFSSIQDVSRSSKIEGESLKRRGGMKNDNIKARSGSSTLVGRGLPSSGTTSSFWELGRLLRLPGSLSVLLTLGGAIVFPFLGVPLQENWKWAGLKQHSHCPQCISQETNHGTVKPQESSGLKTISQVVQSEKMVKKHEDQLMDAHNDSWWLSLPYALAIVLHMGSEPEGPEGLYSLKMDDNSYTIAFEDRHDASHFCQILELFFDDLGDFSADIVPLSINELKDEVNSGTMKVVVVRKGQLRLYAGQPLPDVETTLRFFLR
ncbi:hypothetical protein GIB67_015114 [Kingdonia uniflora]|uniref:Uncharacterized protein n=1 Tax=Kingdonia uniflora TaxID=39325 RepID=A0A7J7LJC2_9MAGN|nr:hypothetical protein GIB67_015114 [Kingdonia uniflora]